VGNCAAGQRIESAEVVYINSKLGAMNAAIAGAATAVGVEFVDVTEALDGRELPASAQRT
jgi:hypothetical protein